MDKKLRRAIIAGNWKMNNTCAATKSLIEEMKPLVVGADCGVIICAPFTSLIAAVEAAKGSNIEIGAENCHWAKSGAFTGEISAEMLLEIGVKYVIIGHSERRQYFGETDETVNSRVKAALEAGLSVILCVGETLSQREDGKTEEVCKAQTVKAFEGIPESDLARIIIAYEPVWAIGTGKTATSEQANEVNAYIRGVVEGLYGKGAADAMTIQYGGSMNAKNAEELLDMPDVDGGLIGGASLKAEDFSIIVKAASR